MQYSHFTIIGHVQGVGFRERTRQQATQAGLKGWVANRADGSVEIFCRGAQEAVDLLASWLKQGPLMARVDTVLNETITNANPVYREIRSCDGFSIRF